MANTLPHEQEAFDAAWQQEQVPPEVTLESAQKTAEALQQREQAAQDYKAQWTTE